MKKMILTICVSAVVTFGLLLTGYLLGQRSVKVLNEKEIENAAQRKEEDICQSIMYILNDPDSLERVTNLDPNEWKTKITTFGPAETIYYTNYGGHIRVTTEKPAWED